MIIIRRVRRNTTIIALKKHWNAILGYIYMIMILSSTLKRTQSNNRYITKALSQFLTVVWSSTYFPVPTLYDILYIFIYIERERERRANLPFSMTIVWRAVLTENKMQGHVTHHLTTFNITWRTSNWGVHCIEIFDVSWGIIPATNWCGN